MEETTVKELRGVLQRVFCLPITRSTLRELQNGVLFVSRGDQKKAQGILETLITGQEKVSVANHEVKGSLKDLLDTFTIPCRMAQEVFERGEFISIVTSDVVTREDSVMFLNLIRRIDGQELRFLTDPTSLTNCALHFVGRMEELKKLNLTKKSVEEIRKQLQLIQEKAEKLLEEIQ